MASQPKARAPGSSGIRSIAEALGISVATVHRALHNQGRVSAKTRERVLRVANELEYRPNLAARDLRLNRHFRISVHFPSTIASFFDSLRVGIEEGVAPFRSALDIQFHTYPRSAEQARKSIQAAIEDGVDGIITVPANTAQMAELVRSAKEKATAVVYVSTDAPESGRLTAVTAHPFYCGAMAAEALGEAAKKRGQVIVLSGDLENLNQTEKIRGFRTMLAQIAPSLSVAAVLETHDSPEKAAQGVCRSFRNVPDLCGIYVSSSNSIAALTEVQKMGRLNEVSIVTTDLFPELIPYLRARSVRATIYQCPEVQGTMAIRAMYHYLMEGIVPKPSIGVVPQLVMKSNLDLYTRDSDLYRTTVLA